MMHDFINWIDLLWVPVALLVLHKGQRLKGAFFVLACVLMLRLQIQFMQEIGFGQGYLGLWDWDVFERGLVIYSLFILGYILLSYGSPNTDRFVLMAASITIFITAFCVSTAAMVL